MRYLPNLLAGAALALAMDTEGARGSGGKTSGKSSNGKTERVMKRYEVYAYPRKALKDGTPIAQLIREGKQTRFVVEAPAYKEGWELGRDYIRLGTLPDGHNEDGTLKFRKIEPGSLTAKQAFQLDKSVKTDVLSAVDLVRVAEERGIELSAEFLELYEELVPESQRTEAGDEGEGEDEEGEEAAEKAA